MSIVKERIKGYIESIEYDSNDFIKNVIIGQHVYSVLTYQYLFLNVSRNSQILSKGDQSFLREEILNCYMKIIGLDDVWESNNYGPFRKIRSSFAALGVHYRNFGYDSAYYYLFSDQAEERINEYLNYPVNDYISLLKSYMWNKHHHNIKISVVEENRFSENDIVYHAKATFSEKSYSGIGYSKRNATENLSKIMLESIISPKEYVELLKTYNYGKIEKSKLALDSIDYQEENIEISAFSEKYGTDALLLRFALLSRSQLGEDLTSLMDKLPKGLVDVKPKSFYKALNKLGREILLLQIVDHNIKSNNLESVDLKYLDRMSSYVSPDVSPDQLDEQIFKTFKCEEVSLHLIDFMEVPYKGTLSAKDKTDLIARFMAVFFLSNFGPDKKFDLLLYDFLKSIYNEIGLNTEINYRISTLTYLEMINVKSQTNNYEVGDGNYHAEVIVTCLKEKINYICENESMRFAKKEVWKNVYNGLLKQVQEFFSKPDADCDEKVLALFVNGIIAAKIKSNSFYQEFGILNARNFNSITLDCASSIIQRLLLTVKGTALQSFADIIAEANKGLYIEFGGFLYEFSSWIRSQMLENKDVCRMPLTEACDEEIYRCIVNPSLNLQKKILDCDYRLIKNIFPISDEIAKHAIKLNLDSYSLIPYVSSDVETYYQKLKKEVDDLLDIGSISSKAGDGTSITILDSHKPFNLQLEEHIKDLDIQSVSCACGYCFSSGLSLLKNTIDKTLFKNVSVELYVGALQNYDEDNNENVITGIDKKTVGVLNSFLTYDNFSLFTCKKRFYHGKLYFFEGTDESVICMGSSNISRSAFITNYELNILLKVKNDTELFDGFKLWLKQLKHNSKQINYLNEDSFGDNEMKQDGSVLIKHISLSSMRSRISELTNTEVQYRLNLWMSYSPDIVAEDLGILSLPNYFIFVYKEEKLVVLESFEAGNAYFCIRYDDSFENMINQISSFSKTEIFEFSKMTKRGYHVQNKFTLENNIRYYFKRGKRR